MIRAAGRLGGHRMLLLGLSNHNVIHLSSGEPIIFDLQELGLPPCEVVISHRRHEQDIVRQLRQMGPVHTAITCPRCGRTSHHPEDAMQGYCGACHDWTWSGMPWPGRGLL